MNKLGKTTVYLSWFLVLVILSASIYVMIPDKVKLVVENTNSKFYVWEDSSWVLSATEYVNLFDGTTKMRAKSRDVSYETIENITTITRMSLWKDNITTIDTYTFDSTLDDVELFPISHEVTCINCVGKILHFEYRDISYEGETTVIESPFEFGHQMKLDWQEGAYYSKVFQQSVASDKIIVRYRPVDDVESFSVRVFDPPTVNTASILPATPDSSEDLLGSCNGSSTTVSYLGYAWEWYKNGVSYSSSGKFFGAGWVADSSVDSGLTDVGAYSSPYVFTFDDVHYHLISGEQATNINGFSWDGSTWVSNASIVSGLSGSAFLNKVTIFTDDDTNYHLIMGNFNGLFTGFSWNGSTWATNSTVVSGINDMGVMGAPSVFDDDGTLKLITMWNTGATYGYYWNGAGWTYDSSINDGLSTSYSYPTPSIANLNGVNKLIIGVADGTFAGYYWDVNSWVSDSTLISGLVDVGTEATPALYTYNNMWKVIAGDVDGTFTGYSSAPTYDNNTLINVDNVSSSFTSSDDAWILSCSAFDGSASSTWVNSSASTIGSTLTLESVSITPTSPQVTDDLLGYCNVSDSSNVNIGYAWEWYKDDVSFSSGNNLTGTWGSNTTIIAGLTDEGSISKPNAFYMGSNLKLISGVGVGDTTGFEWNGSGWDSDTSILSGIDNNLISYGAPSVYNDGGNFKMIMGNYSGEYIGYDWSGSSWSINSTLVNGLAYLGYFAVPTVFEYDDNWNLITGAQGGTFNGYTWNGTGWDSNTTLVNGLGDVGSNSAPIVFSLGGELKLISGESTNVFNGFEWNGTGWDSDTALISGLSNVGSGSQTVFAIDNVLRFITGNADGTFAGFDLTYPYTSNVLVNIDNLSSASTSSGEDWIFSCRGYNNDYSAWSNSSAVTITITPVIQTSDITPTVAYSGATTSIYGACNATDASSAALTYYYKWYKNDVLDTSGHNTTSLTEGITYNISTIDVVGVVDDEYIFSCLANSVKGNSSWLNSSTLTITNPAPVIVTSTILPASPFGSDDLLGYCNATDVNGDSLVYYYIWYKDDVEDSSGVSSSFTQGVLSNVNDIASTNTAVGEVWKLSCRAYDGNTNSSALNSSGVTILNNAPTMVSTTLYPSATPPTVALYNFTGECKGSDGNSDTLTYYYRWYKNGAINNSGVSASGYTQNVAANISTYNITSVLNDVYIFSCLADDGTDNSSWLNSSTRTIGYVDGNVTLLLDGLGEARKYEYQTSINISANASDTGSYICLDIGYPGYGLDYTCDTGTLSYFLYLGDTSIYTFADGSSSYDFVYPYWSWISKSIKTDVRFDVDSATISLTGVQADYSITMFDDMTTASKTYTVADNSSFLLNLTVDSDMTFLGASFEITSPTNFTNISIDMFNDGVVDYNYNGTIDQYVSKTVTLNTTLLNANISGTTYQTIPFNFSVKSVNSGGQITVSDILFTKVTQSYPNDIKIDIGDDGTSDAEYKGALIGTTLYEDTNNDSESSTGMTCESSSCSYDMSFELNREQTYTTCYMYFLGSGIDSTFTEDFSDNDYMYSETLNVDNYFRQVEMDGTSGSYTNGEYISKTIRTMENTKYYLTLAASEQKDSGADIAYYVSLDNGSNWYQTVLNAPYFIAAGGKKPAYKFVMTSNAAKTANAYVTGVVLTDVGDYATDINLTVANTQHDYSGTFNAATGLYKANFGCTALNTYLDSCTALTCDVPVEINFTGPGTITASQYYFGGELDQAVLDIEVIKKHLQDAQLSTTIVNSTNDGDILNGSTVYAYLSFPRYSVAKDLFINITGGYER